MNYSYKCALCLEDVLLENIHVCSITNLGWYQRVLYGSYFTLPRAMHHNTKRDPLINKLMKLFYSYDVEVQYYRCNLNRYQSK